MRAILQDAYGPAPEDVLRVGEAERPAIGPDEVLVRVLAASIDRGTWHLMAGVPYPVRLAGFGVRAPKYNPGRSLAGTVVEAGANVTGLQPGDQVYGSCNGSLAEEVRAQPKMLAAKPASLSFEEAAAVPISGLTALQAVRDRARLKNGERVLVVGASGGVGTFAVQVAKAFGAHVTGVCSTAKVEAVRGLGADDVIDYTQQDFADGTRRYDAVLDTGGGRRLAELRRALTPRGRLVIVGTETGGPWLAGLDRALRAHLLSPFVRQQLGTFVSSENAADLDALRELIDAGAVRPLVDRVYPLEETAAAIRRMLDGKAVGKLVISVADPPAGAAVSS